MFSSRFSRILISSVVAVVLAVGHPSSSTAAPELKASAALALTRASATGVPLAKAKGKSMTSVIKQAKKKNKAAFKKRLKTLKKSSALISIIDKATYRHQKLYIEFFAAVVTQKGANKLVKMTKGKHFVVTGTASRPKVILVSNVTSASAAVEEVFPRTITCWQGWVSFWSFWVGSEMICVAFGAAVGLGMSPTGPMAIPGGYIAASACSGLMAYLQQQFIDFEDACVDVPSPSSAETSEPATELSRRLGAA